MQDAWQRRHRPSNEFPRGYRQLYQAPIDGPCAPSWLWYTSLELKLKLNSLPERLAAQGFVAGTFLTIPSPQIVEILGLAGFDFVVIDTEHGSIHLESTENLVRAAATTGICPLVRVSHCDPVAIRQPLDMGAAGIHVPQIASAAQARLAVTSARFHPAGDRGLQPYVRAASYRAFPTAEFLAETNRSVFIVLHIEGAAGVAAFDEIAAVEGVNVAFLGPYDLSQSLGIPGQVDSPLVREKMEQTVRKAKNSRIEIGTFCDNVTTAREWLDLGVTYLAVSLDAGILLAGAKQMVGSLKGL
jgi:4-hydroxy-2-oxoheptanedioate aldolase